MSEQLSFIRNSGTKVASLDLRLCVLCNDHKPLDEFCPRGTRCNPCKLIKKEESRLRRMRKDRIRMGTTHAKNLRRLRWTGLTVDEYDKMLENQQGKCAICGGGREKQKYSFSVDHCHATGEIRGILCSNCNAGLGFFKDNPQSLTNALTYLISSGI